jgi:membrane-bound lytic murein transglycosylase MltF
MIRHIAIASKLAILLLLAACSESSDAEEFEAADSGANVVPPTVAQPRGEDETRPESQSPPSLDELVPETLDLLVRPWTGDLDGMAERRVVRTLVVSGGPQFFYYQGKPRGIISEMLVLLQREMNASLGRRLDQIEFVAMPVSRDILLSALLSGKADLVAADLTVTDERSALVDFSEPFIKGVNEVLVFTPQADREVSSIEDLSGREIYVRKSSSYFEHLSALNAEFKERAIEPVKIIEANELLRTGDILEMVNAGLIEATIVDNYKGRYWSEVFPDIRVREDLVLHSGGDIAWAFRKDSPQLAAVVNKFVTGHRQGTLIGNVLIERYMGNLHWVRNSTSTTGMEKLRPLMKLFDLSAANNDLNPLMLAAQAYQESELDHSRKSPAGAVGIMQIKPATAADKNVGIDDISATADNIEAGARYMRFLIDRYFSDEAMDESQRWFFALAAYNAGPARIQRLRRQAAAEGYDPNRWLDNVEILAARKIGRETVRYVRNVFKYFVAYQMARENRAARQALESE